MKKITKAVGCKINRRKVLSLALAVVMTAGLCVTVFAADFPDQDEIVNLEAATFLKDMSVMVGDGDGNFDPARNVTRAEMAKMIYVILNDGDDGAASYLADDTGLTDTASHWARGYINYCLSQGIISDDDGIFNPNGSVLGVEASRMLLIALGYDPVEENLINHPAWELNVNVIAQRENLYKGILDTNKHSMLLSRDDAALLIYNMVQIRDSQDTP